jgi:hypothetical protein
MHAIKVTRKRKIFKGYNPDMKPTEAFIIYRLNRYPNRAEDMDLPPREIDLTSIPLFVLQRIFHAGPNNRLLERRHVNDEKASHLQAYTAEQIDTRAYRWEFCGRWSDQDG